MSIHVRLVLALLLAHWRDVSASRIQHRLKDSLEGNEGHQANDSHQHDSHQIADEEASIDDSTHRPRIHTAGKEVKLHQSLHQAMGSTSGASLVQDKANSTQTMLHADNSSVHTADEAVHKANSTYAQRLASMVVLLQPLAGKWKKHVIVGLTGLVVLACCFGYCLFDHLCCARKGKGTRSGSSGKKRGLSAEASKRVTFERKTYVFEGREVFDWEQTDTSIKLFIKVPPGLTKTDLDIKIGTRHLQIGCVGKEPFMKEEVYDNINVEDSGWRLRSNGELQVMLQKTDSSVWPRVLK